MMKLSECEKATLPVLVRIVSEAPTPHNNYFFGFLAKSPDISLEIHYVYDAKTVPGRPWKTLEEVAGAVKVRTGISKWVDFSLLWEALTGSSVFFIIGWNYLSLCLLICALGLRRGSLLMWFDTPHSNEDLRLWKFKDLLKLTLIRMINRSRGTVFVTGNLAKEALLTMGFAPKRLCVLPFFVPPAKTETNNERRQAMRVERGLHPDQILFMAAGRFVHSKGFDIFIEALSKVKLVVPEGWQGLLVGSGPELESLKRICSSLRLSDNIIFVPWLEPHEFQQYMQLCDLLVAPARFDPFPTTVISAMQTGKAVVATRGVGSAVEFIQDGQNGAIVPTADPASLAESLLHFLCNRELIDLMGVRARSTLAQWPVERGVEILRSALPPMN